MTRPGRRARLLAILALLLAPGGCATSSTYRSVTVEVREGTTGTPVPSALVRLRSLSFFVPGASNGILDPSPPRSARGLTDEEGRARLQVIMEHPVQVMVTAPGFEPLVIDLPELWRLDGPTEWLTGDPPDPLRDVRRLETRFRSVP